MGHNLTTKIPPNTSNFREAHPITRNQFVEPLVNLRTPRDKGKVERHHIESHVSHVSHRNNMRHDINHTIPISSSRSNDVTSLLLNVVKRTGGDLSEHESEQSIHVPVGHEMKGFLIGKGGCQSKEFILESGCSTFNVHEDHGRCTIVIEGSASACAACYLLVMRKLAQKNRIPMDSRDRRRH